MAVFAVKVPKRVEKGGKGLTKDAPCGIIPTKTEENGFKIYFMKKRRKS